jgi:hypothetical protein
MNPDLLAINVSIGAAFRAVFASEMTPPLNPAAGRDASSPDAPAAGSDSEDETA